MSAIPQPISHHMHNLSSDSHFEVSVDAVQKSDWESLLSGFRDASIFQTWSYGSIRWGEPNISHLVLKKDSTVVAAAQVRIESVPPLKCGIAYVKWGPMWKRRGVESDPQTYIGMLLALKEEYACRRGLLLRVISREVDSGAPLVPAILGAHDFKVDKIEKPYTTLIMDLSLSMDELSRNLAGTWRRNLRLAQANALTVQRGQSEIEFGAFIALYEEMVRRKHLVQWFPIFDYLLIQQDLPTALKPQIFICRCQNEPIAGLLLSTLGDTGLFLLGASGDKGRSLRGSYLLQWNAIEYLKSIGARWYDMYGINPGKNPGVYQFKAGLAGKRFTVPCQYPGFDYSDNSLSRAAVTLGERLRLVLRRSREICTNVVSLPIRKQRC